MKTTFTLLQSFQEQIHHCEEQGWRKNRTLFNTTRNVEAAGYVAIYFETAEDVEYQCFNKRQSFPFMPME
jgi:hypothetical protein